MRILNQFRRDESPLKVPEMMGTGVTVNTHGGGVWAWVELPPHATDELNTATLIKMTHDGTSDLRRLIPAGAEGHFKIQWSRHSGEQYRRDEIRPGMSDGQLNYIELGARCIEVNAFPKRQVLLGVRFDQPDNSYGRAIAGKAKRAVGTDLPMHDGLEALEKVMHRVRSWQARMAASVFKARPAEVTQLAWSLRRDVRRTVGALPPGALAGPGQIAQLTATTITPGMHHIEVITDVGPVFLRLLTTSENGFPANDLELPGGEWLQHLNITSLPNDETETDGEPVEVSIRFRNVPAQEAVKRLKDALSLAKEQDREARKGQAEQAPDMIAESFQVLRERIKEVQKGQIGMIEDSTTWMVQAASLRELDQRAQAVVDFYGAKGITVWAPPGIQDLLFKEFIIGDSRRVREFTQFRSWGTLVGAWFHGGSTAGTETGPFLASNVGSTPGPFRNRLSDAQREGKPVTTVFGGASGRGKSTAVELSMLAEAILGSWCLLTDFKGDLTGCADVAEWFDVKVTRLSTAAVSSGSLCPFRYVPDAKEAASYAVDNLAMMVATSNARDTEKLLRWAANKVARYDTKRTRSTAAIIGELVNSDDPAAEALGVELVEIAQDPLARPVAGFPDANATKLPTGAGLVYLRFDQLRWPDPSVARSDWKPGERLSIMLVQAGIAYAQWMGSRVKGIPKVIGLTEIHNLTVYPFGTHFIAKTSLTGRALDENLLLDTQAIARLLAVPDLIDQVSQFHAFGVNTDSEADAQAMLLGLEPEQSIRDGQKAMPQGRCVTKDRFGNLATTHFAYLTDEIEQALSTTPERFDAANLPPIEREEAAS